MENFFRSSLCGNRSAKKSVSKPPPMKKLFGLRKHWYYTFGVLSVDVNGARTVYKCYAAYKSWGKKVSEIKNRKSSSLSLRMPVGLDAIVFQYPTEVFASFISL